MPKIRDILILVICFIVLSIVLEKRDDKLMSIDYCFDRDGQHYLSPDPNCIR